MRQSILFLKKKKEGNRKEEEVKETGRKGYS